MDSNKSYSKLNGRKNPRREFKEKFGPRIGKRIISSFGKVWNNLFSFLFKPNRLSKVSDFHDVREKYFNDEKCDTDNSNITYYSDHQDILLNLEQKEELYFPLPFRNYNLELRGKLSSPKQLNKNSFKTVANPAEILNVISDNSKYLEQNITLRNETKNAMEINKFDTKDAQNFHSSHELNSDIVSTYNLSSSVSSNSEDSCNLQSLISSENDYDMNCEENRHNSNVNFASEKSSANNSFSESFHSDVTDMDASICLSDEFCNFQESQVEINYSDQKTEVPLSAEYLNLVEKAHEKDFKSNPEFFFCNIDSGNTSNARNDGERLANNIFNNILNLSDSTCNFDQEILDNIYTSVESGNGIPKPKRIANGESFCSVDACYVNTAEDNVSALRKNATDNISKICGPVPNLDHEVYNKDCLQIEYDKNYSVTEDVENCLKSGRTIYFSGIRHRFNMQEELIRSTLDPKFDEMLFAKLEENVKYFCDIDNSILAQNCKVKQDNIENKNNAGDIRINPVKDAGNKSCERIICITNHERDIQQIFDTFPNTNTQVREKFSKAKDMIDISNKEMAPFVHESLKKKEKSCNYKIILNEDCKTNDSDGKNSCENKMKETSWPNLEQFIKDSTDVSDIPINYINDLENNCDILKLFKTPPDSLIYRKKLDKNDFVDSTEAMKYKRADISQRENNELEFKRNLKNFNNMNNERDSNTCIETGNQMWDDEPLLLKKGKVCNTVNDNCELNGSTYRNGSYHYQTNNVNYDSESQTALEPYSDVTAVDKRKGGAAICVSEPSGNEIFLSKSSCSKRKTVDDDDKNVVNKDSRKRYRVGTCEKGVQANFWKYLEHFRKYSTDDTFLRSTNEEESEIDFIKSSTSQISSNNTARINNVSFLGKENSPYEIRKKFRFSKNNSQIATQKWSKIQMNLPHALKNTKFYATPVIIQQSRTKTVSKIKNFNVSFVGNLTEKSKNQVEKNIRKISAENRIGKTSETISPTGFQNFMPNFLKEHSDFLNTTGCLQLRRREESNGISCSRRVVRIENYKLAKSSEREYKNCQSKSREAKINLHTQSDSKRRYEHQYTKDKIKRVRTETNGNKILPRKRFLLSKEREAEWNSEFKQSLKRHKNELNLIPNLVMPSHLGSFNSHHDKSFNREDFTKNKFRTLVALPNIKSNYLCCIEAKEDSSFKDEEMSENEYSIRLEPKDFQSIEGRTQKQQRKMEHAAHQKLKFTRNSLANDIATLDDLLLKSRQVQYAHYLRASNNHRK